MNRNHAKRAAKVTPKQQGAGMIDYRLLQELDAAVSPVELATSQRTGMRERVLERVRDPPPAATFTLRAQESGWVEVSELVAYRVLRRDLDANNQTALFRMQPGARMAAHPHTQDEECYLLDGEISIGTHQWRRGDMHVAAPGAQHAVITTRTGAILMVRSEIPVDSLLTVSRSISRPVPARASCLPSDRFSDPKPQAAGLELTVERLHLERRDWRR